MNGYARNCKTVFSKNAKTIKTSISVYIYNPITSISWQVNEQILDGNLIEIYDIDDKCVPSVTHPFSYTYIDVIFNDERAVWYIDILAQMRYSERISMFSNWPPIGQIGIGIMIFVTILLSVLCFFFYPLYAKMENEV